MRRRNRLVLGGSTMIIVSGVAMSTVTSCSNETPADQPAQSLESVVSRVVEASPNRDSTTYETPSRGTAAAVASNVAELLSTGGVGHPFDSYELQRVTVSDRAAGSGADADMSALVEGGDPTAGNGLYVVRNNPDVHSPMIVQIPHPVADQYTERMGTELFATTDARLFMLAGAHRRAGDDSADVAHRSDTTFAAVNDAVVQKGMTVVQIHGFSSEKHDDYGDIVLSSTVSEPSPAVRRLDEALNDHGFDTCTYDGDKCKDLAATTNVQAIAARARGADFIHIEVDRDIRKDESERRELVRVITESLRASGIG
ncbi:MAG: hypothetical protein GX610_16965 [Rhodococcus sp.]|nr:hypothetical protein [Rhodococcus sp. (in: high G+C Gram-positive bacteria)]